MYLATRPSRSRLTVVRMPCFTIVLPGRRRPRFIVAASRSLSRGSDGFCAGCEMAKRAIFPVVPNRFTRPLMLGAASDGWHRLPAGVGGSGAFAGATCPTTDLENRRPETGSLEGVRPPAGSRGHPRMPCFTRPWRRTQRAVCLPAPLQPRPRPRAVRPRRPSEAERCRARLRVRPERPRVVPVPHATPATP